MWFNPLMAGLLRSPLHRLLSHNTMLITVRGRKTGRAVTTPVNYVRRGDDLLTVSFRSRTWWRNLRGGRPVEIVLSGRRRQGFASVAESEAEVGRALTEIASRNPEFARAFGIDRDPAGRRQPSDVARAADTRVIITTTPTPAPA